MEIENKTKKELIQMVKENEFLAQAVEVKDAEITSLKTELERSRTKIKEQEYLAQAVEVKDAEIVKLKKEFETNLQKERNAFGGVGEKVTALQEQNKILQEENVLLKNGTASFKELQEKHALAIKLLEQYILAFRSLAQLIQGGVDNAIALDNLLQEKLK